MGSQPQKDKVFKFCFLMIDFVELFLLLFLVKRFPRSVNFASCYSQNTVKILRKSFQVFSLIFQHFDSRTVYICATKKNKFIKMFSSKSSTT